MKQGKEVRDYIVNVIGYEHLVAIKLYLMLIHCHPFLELREIKDTGEIERIIHVQVNVEHRLVLHRIEALVELHIVLVAK